MKKENLYEKLEKAGFVLENGRVSIRTDTAHHAGYQTRDASNVVQPLLAFCSRHGLTMRRDGGYCTVSKLLGHTKTATTAVYTKATDKLKREAVNALPEINIPVAGGEK
jgi:integrase